jgi:hypothetical protein
MDYLDYPYIVDPAFGPSSHARFLKGCDCSKENFLIAYNEEINEVKLQNPFLSDHDIRLKTTFNLRPRFRSDKASIHNETSGVDTYEGADVELTSKNELYYPIYGRTDTQLDERTKRFTPDQHLPSDTLTNEAIHEAFAQGASRVVATFWRPGQDHRDFVEIVIDRETRRGKIRIVNAEALTGETQDYNNMSKLAQKTFNDLHVYNPADKVFIATDKQIDGVKLVRTLDRIERFTLQEARPLSISDKVAHDTFVTTQTLIDYLRTKKERFDESQMPPMSVSTLLTAKKYREAAAVLETPTKNHKHEYPEQTWKEKAQEILHISSEASEKLLHEVVEIHRDITNATEIIAFAADTQVAVAAGLYALNFMTLREKPQADDGPILLIEEAAVLSEPQKEVAYSLFVSEDKVAHEIVQKFEEVASEMRIDKEATLQVTDLARILDAQPFEEQIEKIEEEKQKTVKKIEFVWGKATELVRRERKQEKLQPERQLSVAIAVWTILKLSNYLRALDSLEQFVKKVQDPSLLVAIRKEKPEGLVQREPAPWILLSIIWYLAQIREQGLVQTKMPIQKNPKKPAPVVIFAYGS